MTRRRPSLESRLESFNKKPKPTPNTWYTVIRGVWIDTISYKAYGYDRSPEIIESNDYLKGRKIDTLTNLPFIHPGDKLWLPPAVPLEPAEPETISAESDTEIGIRIDGKVFKGWITSSIERSINTIVDSFTFIAPFNYKDPDSFYLDPFTYFDVDLFIGGKLFIAGRAEAWNPAFVVNSSNTSITCRSRASVIVDCPSLDKSLSYTKQTLKQIATKIIQPYGIISFFPEGDGGIINKAKRNLQDKIFSFLQGLAKRKGFIINSTVQGGLSFDRANIDGVPIMSLIQGQQPLLEATPQYDGSQRFSEFIAVSQSKGNPSNKGTAIDDSIPVKRPIIFSAKDTEQGNIDTAAKWERARSLAKSAPVTVKVGKWYDDFNELIKENNIVTLKAPNVQIFNETRFLIEKVSFQKEETGRTATLSLVLPQAYTLEFPTSFPWSR